MTPQGEAVCSLQEVTRATGLTFPTAGRPWMNSSRTGWHASSQGSAATACSPTTAYLAILNEGTELP